MPVWHSDRLKQGQLNLECYPPVPEHISLPWNSADELLLEQSDPALPTLILNDRHGALSCGLTSDKVSVWTDSYCATVAIHRNTSANDLPAPDIRTLDNLSALNDVAQVLIQIPKNHDLLAMQLGWIAAYWPEAQVHLAGMAKHVPVSLLNWLEHHADNYEQSRVERKARRISIRGLARFAQPADSQWQGYTHNELTLQALPGVFCRDHLDLGSRVLLDHLPDDIKGRVCDLGCGNGLLGLSVKARFADVDVIACDDSELAVTSAEHNAQLNQRAMACLQSNALSTVDGPLDYVLCNPPFHDGHRQLTQIAETMFADAARKLNPEGQLLVVANRHLPYHQPLGRLFRQVRVISADKRFNVYHCSAPKPRRSERHRQEKAV